MLDQRRGAWFVFLKLKSHERAERHGDGDQLQDDCVVEEVSLRKPKIRPAFACRPCADKTEGAGNTDEDAHQMRYFGQLHDTCSFFFAQGRNGAAATVASTKTNRPM